jgi:hypothetical protein
MRRRGLTFRCACAHTRAGKSMLVLGRRLPRPTRQATAPPSTTPLQGTADQTSRRVSSSVASGAAYPHAPYHPHRPQGIPMKMLGGSLFLDKEVPARAFLQRRSVGGDAGPLNLPGAPAPPRKVPVWCRSRDSQFPKAAKSRPTGDHVEPMNVEVSQPGKVVRSSWKSADLVIDR